MSYDLKQIADEIYDTAQGISYYGNSLRVAKDFPFITSMDRTILDGYLTGATIKAPFAYRMGLQDIAIKIRCHIKGD